MRIGKGQQIVPVALVESGKRCEDENCFEIFLRIGGGRYIVQWIVNNWRRLPFRAGFGRLFSKRCSWW